MNSLHLYSLHHSNSSSLNSSILKQSRSNNPSPKPADRHNLKSPPATSRGKSRPRPNSICGNASLEKQYQEPRTQNLARNLSLIKESHAILKEEHLLLRNDMFGFIEHLREAFEHMEHAPQRGFSHQSTDKIHRLISELDETKFGSKKLLQERDNKIKELNFIIMEKEQEINATHKYHETAKRELKEKDKTILRLEKTLVESKRKFQQEIDKIESERVSIENHYLKEIQALQSRREHFRGERPTLHTYRDREREPATTSRTRGNPGRSADRVDSLIQEIEALRNEKENLNLQLQKGHNFAQENENLRRALAEKQDLLRETKKQVDFLSSELENSLDSRSKLQSQLNISATQMEEMISQLNFKNEQIEQLKESHPLNNSKLRNSTNNLLTKSIESDREFQTLKKEAAKPNSLRRKESASTQSILSHRDSFYKSRVSMPSSREQSPKRVINTVQAGGGVTTRNPINISIREKDLEEKVANLEKVQRNQRTKIESLQTENANLLKKIALKDRDIVSLKQEIQSIKDKSKKTGGPSHLEKLVKDYEHDLRKAQDEIHKLNLIRDGLETIIKGRNLDDDDDEEEREIAVKSKKAQAQTKNNSRRTSPSPSPPGKRPKIPSLTLAPAPISSSRNSLQRNIAQSPSSDIHINEVGGEEERMIGDFATKRDASLRASSTQRSYLSDDDEDDDQDEIDKLRAENYELNVELTAKDAKLQNLMNMSTVSMKNLANEFLKLASNIFAEVNEKVQKETEKWEDFEKLVRKLILKHMHATNETSVANTKPLVVEKKSLPQPQPQKREERVAPKTHRASTTATGIPEKEKTAIRKSLESKIWVTPLPTPTLSHNSSKSSLKQNLNDSKPKNSLDTKNNHSSSLKSLPTSTVKKTVTKNPAARHERGKSFSGNQTARFEAEISRPEPTEESRSIERLESSRSTSQLVSPRQSESDSRRNKAEEGALGLKNLLEEMKNLRNSVAQNNGFETTTTSSPPQNSLSEQLKHKQKLIEMFENILNTEKGDRSDLEDIREVEQECDTLQDEVSFEQSYDIKGDGVHHIRFKN